MIMKLKKQRPGPKGAVEPVKKIWKGKVLPHFKAQSQNLLGQTKENHK
jgi:hypothetical protein